jgi:hypothetical protein
VESLTFYSIDSFKACHLELAERVIDAVGGAPLSVINTADLDVIGRLWPAPDRFHA